MMDMFLIPGVFGDDPQLREFRSRLQGAVDFDIVPLPDVDAHRTLLFDMVACGRFLTEEIDRRQPVGSVALVGYSFGGSMALEVASQLIDAGREISFLAVLDGPFEPPLIAAASEPSGLLHGPRAVLKSAVVNNAGSLDGLRSIVARVAERETALSSQAEVVRRAVLWHLRNKALKGWTPRPCLASGLYVSSGQYGLDNRARWIELCPNLTVVDVASVHEHLLQTAALETLLTAFLQAVRRSSFGEA